MLLYFILQVTFNALVVSLYEDLLVARIRNSRINVGNSYSPSSKESKNISIYRNWIFLEA